MQKATSSDGGKKRAAAKKGGRKKAAEKLKLEFDRYNQERYGIFVNSKTGEQVGPKLDTIEAANAFLDNLLDEGRTYKKDAGRLRGHIDAVFARIEADRQPELVFVRSHSGQNGVFILQKTGRKVGDTMKNSFAAKKWLVDVVEDGKIRAVGVEKTEKQIDEVFQAILEEAGDNEPGHHFVRAGKGGHFVTRDGVKMANLHSSKGAALSTLEVAASNNQVSEAEVVSLRSEVDEVFAAIAAEQDRTVKFVLCPCGTCGGYFVDAQTGAPLEGTERRYPDRHSAQIAVVDLFRSSRINNQEAGLLQGEVAQVFEEVERYRRDPVASVNRLFKALSGNNQGRGSGNGQGVGNELSIDDLDPSTQEALSKALMADPAVLRAILTHGEVEVTLKSVISARTVNVGALGGDLGDLMRRFGFDQPRR